MENKKPDVFTSNVISGYRITIPETIREIWQLEEGDCIEIKVLSVVKKCKE